MQKGRRAMRDEGLDTLTIGFAIYQIKEGAPRPLGMVSNKTSMLKTISGHKHFEFDYF